jgi:heat shock protein HslJ
VIHTVRLAVAILLTASLTVACSESSSTPTSPTASSGPSSALTASQIAGSWTLVSVQVDGQAAQAAPSGYSLTLGEGQLSTRVDCNTCSGRFTVEGQLLTAGPALACTRAACATMAFETAYTGVLSGQSTVTASGNTLVLSSSRGTLRFTR